MYLNARESFNHLALLLNDFFGDVSCANLLCNAACLSVLNVGPSQLVQDLCFAGVDVSQDTHHWRPQVVRRSSLFVGLTPSRYPIHCDLGLVLFIFTLIITITKDKEKNILQV